MQRSAQPHLRREEEQARSHVGIPDAGALHVLMGAYGPTSRQLIPEDQTRIIHRVLHPTDLQCRTQEHLPLQLDLVRILAGHARIPQGTRTSAIMVYHQPQPAAQVAQVMVDREVGRDESPGYRGPLITRHQSETCLQSSTRKGGFKYVGVA
jgi:hypothetical protein